MPTQSSGVLPVGYPEQFDDLVKAGTIRTVCASAQAPKRAAIFSPSVAALTPREVTRQKIEAICAVAGVDSRAMFGGSYKRNAILARHQAMRMLARETPMTLPQIGEMFGRAACTVHQILGKGATANGHVRLATARARDEALVALRRRVKQNFSFPGIASVAALEFAAGGLR